jgi:8-oxo-dGTP diphosphatase
MSIRVKSELSAIRPLDDLERAHLEDALAWVDSGVPLYRVQKPAIPPKHLVSYFAVIDGDYVLLVDHRNAQLWLPTGGHVEPDEDPRATVVREIHEELGLVVGIDSVGPPVMVTVTDTVGLTRGHTDVSLWYAVRATRDTALSYDPGEFLSVRWFHFSEVPLGRSDPHMGRFLEKLRAA